MRLRARLTRRLVLAAGLLALAALFWFGGGLAKALHYKAAQALAGRDYEAAEDVLNRVHRLGCANAETAFWEARLRRKQLRVTEVLPLLTKAETGGFDDERLRREALLLQAQTGRIRPIVDELNSMMIDPRGDGSEICEAYVNGALISGATDLALRILPVWKQEFPLDPQPHYAHARLLEYRGRVDDAQRELHAAIKKNPRHWPARYALGRILAGRNQFEAALVQFDAAAQMRDNAAPQYQRAKCLRALDGINEARNILVELVKRPEQEIHDSFARVGEPQVGTPIQLELGTLEAALGNDEAALRWLNEVLAHDPKNTDARYARAMVLRALQRTDEAERDFAEVRHVRKQLQEVDRLVDEINRAPDDPNVAKRCRVGELFLKYENGRRGEFWVRDALNHDPNYAPAHALLAQYYAGLAKREPAYASLAEEHRRAAAQANEEPAASPPGQAAKTQ